MADLPHPWGVYARLQNELRRNPEVGNHSCGIEAGMDFILESASRAPPTEDEVNQVIATSRRRERHRASRREPLPDDVASAHPVSALIARSELAAIRRKFGDHNWSLLTAVGIGSSYKEISVATSASQGALRVKVRRLRLLLADAA